MRSGSLGGLFDAWRMILLPVAQNAMAVAADGQPSVIVGSAGDVMKLKDQRFVDTAEGASRVCSCPIAPAPAACDALDSIRDCSWVNSFK